MEGGSWGGREEARRDVFGGGEQLYCTVRERQMREERGGPAADSNRLQCGTYYMHQISLPSTLARLYSSRINLLNPPAMIVEIIH